MSKKVVPRFLLLSLAVLVLLGGKSSYAQVCATPGFDGSAPVGGQVNTYYAPAASITLTAGATAVTLTAVPQDVFFGSGTNTYKPIVNGTQEYIKSGDLLLIIQMQDATINSSNSNLYGANSATSGPDNLGGTGYTSLGNTGLFEYVVGPQKVIFNFLG